MAEELVDRVVLPVGVLDVGQLLAQVLQPFEVVLELQIVFAHLNVQVELNPHDALLGGGCLLLLLVGLWL